MNTCDNNYKEKYKNDLGFLLKRVMVVTERQLNELFANTNLTETQSKILGYLMFRKKHGLEVSQKDLETAFNISHVSIHGTVQRLLQKEYVVVHPSKNDRRLKMVEITESGKKVFIDTVLIRKNYFEKIKDKLSTEEIDNLSNTLNKIVNIITDSKE